MCGIAGYFGDKPVPSGVLERMIAAVRHRGPDGTGTLSKPGIGLGHARLSIIDLAGGRQPLANEDGSIWITLNGEIFNHVELRRDLERRGHRFRTRSDTEVVVHSYEERGSRCIEELNGDFAFALWDKRRQRLLLARDRAGVRPLYYTLCDGVLVFASEVKALLRFPGVQARLDPIALDQCFTFWFPLPPRTPYRDIHELPPGSMLEAQDGRISVRRYWQLAFPPAGEHRADTRSEEEVANELHALLADATRLRLRADVPVGAYLSGGLDSSLVTALASSVRGSSLRTFSVGFESAEFDEAPFQRQVIESLGTDHAGIHCTRADIAAHFPQVIRHTERPVLRTAPAPLYLLSRLVRDSGFKVVLTGEGADEILGGYDLFKEAKVRRFWARQPHSRWRPMLLERLYPWLPAVRNQPAAYLQAFFGAELDRVADPLFSHLPRVRLTERIKAFFSEELRGATEGYDALEDLRAQLPAEFSRWDPLCQAQYLESAYLLPGYILSSQGDRVAMAHAVEARFPFLDPRVIEFASRIPPRMKLKGLREKHILKRASARDLPEAIVQRPKQPYRAPESECFFAPAAPAYVSEVLSEKSLEAAGCFDVRKVAKLADKCRTSPGLGIGNHMALVGILSTQLLHRHFTGNAPAGAGEPMRTIDA